MIPVGAKAVWVRSGFVTALAAALASLAGPVLAQQVVESEGRESAAVIFYRDRPVNTAQLMQQVSQGWIDPNMGLALVVERRIVDVPEGEGVIRFHGVADGLVPQSVVVEGLPGDQPERNADFDLITPQSLIQRSTGQVVTVGLTNPVTGEETRRRGLLRAGAGGAVVEVDGQFEALDCSGQLDRLILEDVPPGLGPNPILSVRTRGPGGRAVVTLSYLTTGLQWSADYVARLNPDGETLSLTGWLTLANTGGSAFPNAQVQAVAGQFGRDAATGPVSAVAPQRNTRCWPQGTTTDGLPSGIPPPPYPPTFDYPAPSSPPLLARPSPPPGVDDFAASRARRMMAQQGDLGDYKLYSLPEPVDVGSRQTKQVRFLEAPQVGFEHFYSLHVIGIVGQPQTSVDLQSMLRLRNEEASGLGMALPDGGVALFEAPAGQPNLVAQLRWSDTPIGLPITLTIGDALDVTAEVIRNDTGVLRSDNRPRWHREMDVRVSNLRAQDADFEITLEEALLSGFQVVEANAPESLNAQNQRVWRMRVPAGDAATFRIAFDLVP